MGCTQHSILDRVEVNDNGRTAWYSAPQVNDGELIRTHGADPNIHDLGGTPPEYCSDFEIIVPHDRLYVIVSMSHEACDIYTVNTTSSEFPARLNQAIPDRCSL